MPTTLQDVLDSPRTRRAVVMGILNVTPDSFSDGGLYFDPGAAVARAAALVAEGAGIIDIGPESTRPGSDRVPPGEQIRRIEPVLAEVARLGVVVSIDTMSAEVAGAALDAGAGIVNDISAGRSDPAMLAMVAKRGAAIVLVHMLGEPKTMQQNPAYEDVVGEVTAFLSGRLAAAHAAGIPAERCIVDPGIGFGKRLADNLALLAGLGRIADLGRPVLLGASRKAFLGTVAGREKPADRVAASVAAALAARRRGATLFRVHDVVATVDVLAVQDAIDRA
jgi:dihydropteroate synthase